MLRHQKISLCRHRQNICVLSEKENIFYPPVGDSRIVETVRDLMEWQKSRGRPTRMFGITDGMLNQNPSLADGFVLEDNRDYYDYVYLTKDLIELKGRKYDGKRNLIRQFKKKYPFEYLDMTKEIIPECMEFQRKWCEIHGCLKQCSLYEENIATQELMNNFEHLDVFGCVIKINGEVESFSVAGELNSQTALVYVEKGNPAVKGVYQAVNQMFCGNKLSKYEYVNREQDEGDSGLRKAKLSYHPHHLVNKKILKI